VVNRDYLGFTLEGPGKTRRNDGIIRSVQPDVRWCSSFIAGLGLPQLETMSVEDARAFSVAMAAQRPTGPDVGDIVDGVLPGAVGGLAYVCPSCESGPHPIVAYFHGGGWVLGSHHSDDPFCRDLCARSGAIVVSADYRHAPEGSFPRCARRRLRGRAVDRGTCRGTGRCAGPARRRRWSAGANVAAVVCQMARDAGGPEIAGQVLVTPVTDCDLSRDSYVDNAEGYVLTTALMRWFWDHYADPADREHPKASPLRAGDLADLPPALVVTCEFDPLRDEGKAYAEAMAAAGVRVRHLASRGQIHTSLTAVDMVISGAGARAEMGAALREFFSASVPA
jgi:acetyl esterase/lipase